MKEEKKRKPVGLIIGLIFLALVIFIIIYVAISYTSDQSETKERMQEVEELYQSFKDDIVLFNDAREAVYQNVMQDMYYQTLKEKDMEFKQLFQDYLDSLEVLDEDASKLKGKCINILYPDVSVNNKCEAFVLGYEEATNTYVSDVLAYNNNIKEYNQWLKESNSADSSLEEFSLTKEYLDYDGDRKYRGKEEIDSSIVEEVPNE